MQRVHNYQGAELEAQPAGLRFLNAKPGREFLNQFPFALESRAAGPAFPSIRATTAQLVPVTEMNWFFSYGKPASKCGWNFTARDFTNHDPPAAWVCGFQPEPSIRRPRNKCSALRVYFLCSESSQSNSILAW
jgi:hypothetical protein